jgi:hypothetical protein
MTQAVVFQENKNIFLGLSCIPYFRWKLLPRVNKLVHLSFIARHFTQVYQGLEPTFKVLNWLTFICISSACQKLKFVTNTLAYYNKTKTFYDAGRGFSGKQELEAFCTYTCLSSKIIAAMPLPGIQQR